jgi:hypothetical protein
MLGVIKNIKNKKTLLLKMDFLIIFCKKPLHPTGELCKAGGGNG